MKTEIMHQTTEGSLKGTLTFPQVVQMLAQEGVESYQVDLLQKKKTFYGSNGETYIESFDFNGPQVDKKFSQQQVVDAIRASQMGKIPYTEFLNKILKAGTSTYTVYINGQKAIYFGRNGDFHVENFPQAR